MVVKIRLARAGRLKKPFYKIVVANANSPRDGKTLEYLGQYNPMIDLEKSEVKTKFNLDFERLSHWLKIGAQPTDRIKTFIIQSKNDLVSSFASEYEKELNTRKAAAAANPREKKKKKK
jgi:small subunit ribosomal protein S16